MCTQLLIFIVIQAGSIGVSQQEGLHYTKRSCPLNRRPSDIYVELPVYVHFNHAGFHRDVIIT